jgi:hypothetical protein
MTCQRCLSAQSQFRAVTDSMNIAVCAPCAEEARKLGIAVEPQDNTSSIPAACCGLEPHIPVIVGQ